MNLFTILFAVILWNWLAAIVMNSKRTPTPTPHPTSTGHSKATIGFYLFTSKNWKYYCTKILYLFIFVFYCLCRKSFCLFLYGILLLFFRSYEFVVRRRMSKLWEWSSYIWQRFPPYTVKQSKIFLFFFLKSDFLWFGL